MALSLKAITGGLAGRIGLHHPNPRAIVLLLLSAAYAGFGFQELILHRPAAELSQPEFDGPPRFITIDGTSVQYAINTRSTILCASHQFYLWSDGVWLRSSSAAGPFSTQAAFPAELLEPRPADVN